LFKKVINQCWFYLSEVLRWVVLRDHSEDLNSFTWNWQSKMFSIAPDNGPYRWKSGWKDCGTYSTREWV